MSKLTKLAWQESWRTAYWGGGVCVWGSGIYKCQIPNEGSVLEICGSHFFDVTVIGDLH